jgi:hypothetical protein
LAGISNTPGHVPLDAIQRIWQLLTSGFLVLGALFPRLLLLRAFCSRRMSLSLKMRQCSAKALPPPLPALQSVQTSLLHQAEGLKGQRQLPKMPREHRDKDPGSGEWCVAANVAGKGTWPRRAEAMHLPVSLCARRPPPDSPPQVNICHWSFITRLRFALLASSPLAAALTPLPPAAHLLHVHMCALPTVSAKQKRADVISPRSRWSL